MNYTSNYLQSRDIADRILMNVRTPKQSAAGLGSRAASTSMGELFEGAEDVDLSDFMVKGYMAKVKDVFGSDKLKEQLSSLGVSFEGGEYDVANVEDSVRPVSKLDAFSEGALEGDLEFEDAMNALLEKYPGMEKSELFRVVKKESNWDPTVINDSNMVGLFQFSPDTVQDILGTTTEDVATMSPAQQVSLYGEYLDYWDWEPGVPLGMMQAAPALARKPRDEVVYTEGSKAWEQNPGWRPEGGGDITVGSIMDFYN